MTIKKLFAFLFYFDKIDNFDNELHRAMRTWSLKFSFNNIES